MKLIDGFFSVFCIESDVIGSGAHPSMPCNRLQEIYFSYLGDRTSYWLQSNKIVPITAFEFTYGVNYNPLIIKASTYFPFPTAWNNCTEVQSRTKEFSLPPSTFTKSEKSTPLL